MLHCGEPTIFWSRHSSTFHRAQANPSAAGTGCPPCSDCPEHKAFPQATISPAIASGLDAAGVSHHIANTCMDARRHPPTQECSRRRPAGVRRAAPLPVSPCPAAPVASARPGIPTSCGGVAVRAIGSATSSSSGDATESTRSTGGGGGGECPAAGVSTDGEAADADSVGAGAASGGPTPSTAPVGRCGNVGGDVEGVASSGNPPGGTAGAPDVDSIATGSAFTHAFCCPLASVVALEEDTHAGADGVLAAGEGEGGGATAPLSSRATEAEENVVACWSHSEAALVSPGPSLLRSSLLASSAPDNWNRRRLLPVRPPAVDIPSGGEVGPRTDAWLGAALVARQVLARLARIGVAARTLDEAARDETTSESSTSVAA